MTTIIGNRVAEEDWKLPELGTGLLEVEVLLTGFPEELGEGCWELEELGEGCLEPEELGEGL